MNEVILKFFFFRSITIAFGFFFAVIFLIFTYLVKSIQTKSIYFTLLFLAGMGIGGPASLIGGAVSSDLGQRLLETSGVNAISTITGIMEGCGAAGAALTQLWVAQFQAIVFPTFASKKRFFLCKLIFSKSSLYGRRIIDVTNCT